jgi:hypothetical protein
MTPNMDWVFPIAYTHQASRSFLEAMSKQLQLKFEEITQTPFSLTSMSSIHTQLYYSEVENHTYLNVIISSDAIENFASCAIIWQHTKEKRFILPSEDINEGDLIFNWVNLNFDNIAPVEPEEQEYNTEDFDFKKYLNIETSFDVQIGGGESEEGEITIIVEVIDVVDCKKLDQFITIYINDWSAKNPDFRIFAFDLLKQEKNKLTYCLDMGRSHPVPIWKAILEGFESSKIGINRVAFEGN